MAITKEAVIDSLRSDGPFRNVFWRTKTTIKEDGAVLTTTNHVESIMCGSIDGSDNFVDTDISSYPAEVQALCNAMWTTAVKNAWKADLIAHKPA